MGRPRAFRYERARESPIWLLPASGLIQKYDSPRLVPYVSTAKRDTMMSIVMDTFDLYSVFLIVFV